MFKWTTTSFINGANYVDGSVAFKAIPLSLREGLDEKDADKDALRLNHGITLKKSDVTKITGAKWTEAHNDVLTIDPSKIVSNEKDEHYRLYIYIRSVDNADPMYANDFVYKGRPFNLEFMVKKGLTKDKIAETIVRAANKWITLLYGNGNILNFKVNDNKVVITATSEYLRFYLCEIQKYNPTALVWAHDGAFETILSSDKDSDYYDDSVIKINHGNVGFGTYTQLIKDLRLPTNANLRLYADQRDEIPVIGGKYWLYVFTLVVDRPEMLGTSVTGLVNKSLTTHVVFVEDNVKNDFVKELNKVFSNDIKDPATSKNGDNLSFNDDSAGTSGENDESENNTGSVG